VAFFGREPVQLKAKRLFKVKGIGTAVGQVVFGDPHIDPLRDGCRKNKTLLVVGMLTDEVDSAWSKYE
jgi:hypothetical protein